MQGLETNEHKRVIVPYPSYLARLSDLQLSEDIDNIRHSVSPDKDLSLNMLIRACFAH